MASMNVMDARRYVKVGQAAAVVLGLSAATLWALDVPGLTRSLPPQPIAHAPAAPATTASNSPAKSLGREELAAMAGRLEIGANVKKPEVKAEAAAPPPQPPASETEWTYLGCIQEPDRLLALIKVDDHQKVLAQGRKYGDTRLVSVTPDEIVTQDAAGKHRIARAERGETRVAWVKNMPNNALPGVGGVAQPGTNGLSPEVRQRMIERGIDPERAAGRWQQRMNGRGGRGGGPNGGGGARGGNFGGGVGATDAAAATMSGDVLTPQSSTIKTVGPNGETIIKVTDPSGSVKTMRVTPNGTETVN